MRFFTHALGFDDIVRINVLDGVRVHFHNGDVAHIRPSGNAPQLRIYANSDSQARADQIVELTLRESDGILRQMERAFAQRTVVPSEGVPDDSVSVATPWLVMEPEPGIRWRPKAF
jgi:hypothetical protein